LKTLLFDAARGIDNLLLTLRAEIAFSGFNPAIII